MGIQLTKTNRDKNMQVYYGSGARPAPKLRWSLVVLLLSLPLLYLAYQLTTEFLLVRFSGIVTYDSVTLRAPDAGYIKSLYILNGEKIHANQTLLQFDSPELTSELTFLEREKKRITSLMDSINQQDVNDVTNELEIAKQDIASSQQIYDSFKQYTNKGNLALLQLEEARKNYITAKKNYVSIKQKIATNKTVMEVNYKRKIFELENRIDQIKAKMQSFSMRSPNEGTIMSISTHVGEFVSPGQSLLTLVTDKNLRIVVFVDPKYMEEVYRGKKVILRFPNNEIVKGHIVNTPSFAEQTPLSQINPMAKRENKLIAIVQPDTNIPKAYQIFGIPVSAKLD